MLLLGRAPTPGQAPSHCATPPWCVVATSIDAEPPALASLDAIHLATALSLGDELSAFVAYDRLLLAAAKGAGLPVETPGLAA
jgi:predicted nucleic acid-binding protein